MTTFEDVPQRDTDEIVGTLGDLLDVVQRTVLDDSDRLCIVDGILDELFEIGKAERIVIANELVHGGDFVVDLGRVLVGFLEELVFGIVFDGFAVDAVVDAILDGIDLVQYGF